MADLSKKFYYFEEFIVIVIGDVHGEYDTLVRLLDILPQANIITTYTVGKNVRG